jgi:hypothetical protein
MCIYLKLFGDENDGRISIHILLAKVTEYLLNNSALSPRIYLCTYVGRKKCPSFLPYLTRTKHLQW